VPVESFVITTLMQLLDQAEMMESSMLIIVVVKDLKQIVRDVMVVRVVLVLVHVLMLMRVLMRVLVLSVLLFLAILFVDLSSSSTRVLLYLFTCCAFSPPGGTSSELQRLLCEQICRA
jgi:hypothetical protein